MPTHQHITTIRSSAHALLLTACLATALHAQTPPPDSIAPRVDSIARGVLAETGVPSATVAVVRHGRLVYTQAYGRARLEPAVAATPAMRYALGSISKQFTAAALLLLQEEGKLSIADPVEKWVPGLTRGSEVTLRMVLSHTSGYQDFWPQDYVMPGMTRPVAPAAILERWAKQPLDFEPGTRWQYSNTNYTIAALVVEKASGMPFFRFVQTRILDPLGLASAVDLDARGAGAIEPAGYMRYGLGPLRPAIPTGEGWTWGAGELAMTPGDLAKWDIAMMRHALLSPASWREMQSATLLRNGAPTNYGLGVFVWTQDDHHYVEHSGEVAGFTAENILLPEDSAAVIVLTNQDAAPAAGSIAQQIARSLFGTQDVLAADRTAQARRIFEGLLRGTVDRSLFTPNANAYLNEQALRDFASSLAPLGTVTSFEETGMWLRGGMTGRSYRAAMSGGKALHVWTYETADGKLEQYQMEPAE
jgi:CubicO group peptidase (beta-lactamase class C family)